MINIIGKKKHAFIISLAFVSVSLYMLLSWGLKLGIDFTGGTLMEVRFSKSEFADKGKICAVMPSPDECNQKFIFQSSDDNKMIIKYGQSDEAFNKSIVDALKRYDRNIEFLRVDYIGSAISEQLKDNAVTAIIFTVSMILIYIAWAFRKISFPVSSWSYGLGAIIALVHDIVIVLGVFAFLGHFYGVEVGIPFVAALLTILGYSVNDTIVVYDRIRENILRTRDTEHFERLVNKSLNETLARSINTSVTVVVVLLAMIFWGSSTLVWFCVALLVGVVVGTYSSIFIATSFVYVIYDYKIEHNLLGRINRMIKGK